MKKESRSMRVLCGGTREIGCVLFALCAWLLSADMPVQAEESKKGKRPNVVVFLTDDQGWGDLSLHGNTHLKTPHLDQLARDGAQFDRFYVSPVCSPTRAEFLTGRYHTRSGVYSTSRGGERMDTDETTIADLFKTAGYRTAAFGKWHNGMQFPYHPNARGFEEFYGFCSGHWGNYFSPMLEHNGKIVQGEGFVIDDFTTRAMNYIEANQDEPFFVYLPYCTPHSPMQVPDRWWDPFKDHEMPLEEKRADGHLNHSRAAMAFCENIDWNVGRVLKKLDDLKLSDDTIVVFFCDNGPNGSRWNGGMRGKKGSTDEGGVRSPLFIRWPGQIPDGLMIKQIASARDLLPTLTTLAGVSANGTKPLDGVDLADLLRGKKSSLGPRSIISNWRGRVSIRTQRHRLDHQGRLYDMIADPGQKKDVTKLLPALAAKLKKQAEEWKKEYVESMGPDDRPFVIGHPDGEITQLPARDATATGGIKRSSKHPNCSFFTNWTSKDEQIVWDCEVGQAGEYEVELFYTCPEADAGSVFELSFKDARLKGTIAEGYDPPLLGKDKDRYGRTESYDKLFKRITLGSIHLEEGPGTLTIRPLDIPGSQVMDFRLLLLTRK